MTVLCCTLSGSSLSGCKRWLLGAATLLSRLGFTGNLILGWRSRRHFQINLYKTTIYCCLMFSSVRKFRSNQGLHVGLTLSAPVWNKINNASIACLCSVPFPPCGRPNFSLFLLSHCHYVWQCILIISLPDMSLKMPYKWTLQLAPGTKFLNSRAPCARGCTLNIAMTSEIKEDFVQEYQYKLDSYLTMYGVTPRNILIDWYPMYAG